MAEIVVTAEADNEIIDLLAEWFAYWEDDDNMPGKMPAALHVRTAIALLNRGRIVRGRSLT